MKPVICLCVLAILTVCGCLNTAQSNQPAAQVQSEPTQSPATTTVVVSIAGADNLSVEVLVGTVRTKLDVREEWIGQLADLLKATAKDKTGQKVEVVLQAEDGVYYENDARVILACKRAMIANLTFAGVPYPKGSGAAPRPRSTTPRLLIKLFDVGLDGLFDSAGKHEFVSIELGEQPIPFRAGKPDEVVQGIERAFQELQERLREMWESGVPQDQVVLIAPTMQCQHRWVVRACKVAIAAGFTNIVFGIPYE